MGAPPLLRFLREGGDFDFLRMERQLPHPVSPKNGETRVGHPLSLESSSGRSSPTPLGAGYFFRLDRPSDRLLLRRECRKRGHTANRPIRTRLGTNYPADPTRENPLACWPRLRFRPAILPTATTCAPHRPAWLGRGRW